MLEIASLMEKEKSFKLTEDEDIEFSDISFEELLEQEKKDSFWLVVFLCFSGRHFCLSF